MALPWLLIQLSSAGAAPPVVAPSGDSGMVSSHTRGSLRKWIQELIEARAAAARAAREATNPKRAQALKSAAKAGEEAYYAALAAASDRLESVKLANQVKRAANLLNAAVAAKGVAATIAAAQASREYSFKLAEELEEDEDMNYIKRFL